MQIRRLRPLYYGAFLWIPQLAAAQPAEPAPEKPFVGVRAEACPKGWAILPAPDGQNGDLVLVDDQNRVVERGHWVVVERWFVECPKKGARK